MRAQKIIQIIFGGVLLYLLWWRWRVGMGRFFDVDEFTHIHWAANLFKGEKPYVDFFTFFTPGFSWFLRPLFWIFGSSISLFLAARVVAFFVFLGILGCLGYLFGKMRGRKWVLLPMILLAFLPMPYDKFLEVRPDNLAVLIGLIGLICQIRSLQSERKQWAFLSGFFYSLSLIVLVKMLPFVVVGVFVALLAKTQRVAFFAGLGMPFLFFFFWLLSLGDLSTAWYSLTRMPLETNAIGRDAIMEPHLFFFPNASFYGGWGITPALIGNHAIWVVGIVMGAIRFFTPFITGNGNKKQALGELLIGGTFLLSVFGYVQFFPLKHSQYLIPIAVFIAFYAADGIGMVLDKGKTVFLFFIVLFSSIFLWQQTIAVNQPKLSLSNTIQLNDITKLKALIPAGDRVFDLEGRMIYWKDAYYVCCLPMGLFVHYMSRPPAKLSTVLEASKVPYIYQGESGRLWELGDDLSYIQSHYEKVPGWRDALWIRKKQ